MMKIETARQLFLLDREAKGCVDKTLLDYRKAIDKFIKETGVNELEECNKLTVQQWIVGMKTYKAATANHYIMSVRAFLYFFMEEGNIPTYHIKTVKHQEEPLKLYTDDELRLLIAKPQTDSIVEWRTWAMICFALGTGARISTICNVMWEDIDETARVIYYKHTKNKYTACVPLSPVLLSTLLVWRDIGRTKEYVFEGINHTQMTPEGSYEALRRFCVARGVQRHSWHSFRHNFAHKWIAQGGDLFRLQAMLQHQTLSQTQHYAKIFGEDLCGSEKFTALEQLKNTVDKSKKK